MFDPETQADRGSISGLNIPISGGGGAAEVLAKWKFDTDIRVAGDRRQETPSGPPCTEYASFKESAVIRDLAALIRPGAKLPNPAAIKEQISRVAQLKKDSQPAAVYALAALINSY